MAVGVHVIHLFPKHAAYGKGLANIRGHEFLIDRICGNDRIIDEQWMAAIYWGKGIVEHDLTIVGRQSKPKGFFHIVKVLGGHLVHVCNTSILNSFVAGLCAAASIPIDIHVRVSSGSIRSRPSLISLQLDL
jgi:hypothetical protein